MGTAVEQGRVAGPYPAVRFGGVCAAAPRIGKLAAYDDLFYVVPDNAAFDGPVALLESGDYAVAYCEGSVQNAAIAHLTLIELAQSKGLRTDLPRFEIACLRALDGTGGNRRCLIEMQAIEA